MLKNENYMEERNAEETLHKVHNYKTSCNVELVELRFKAS